MMLQTFADYRKAAREVALYSSMVKMRLKYSEGNPSDFLLGELSRARLQYEQLRSQVKDFKRKPRLKKKLASVNSKR